MRVLALDTTTRAGSVAVVEDDRIVLQRGGDPARTHARAVAGGDPEPAPGRRPRAPGRGRLRSRRRTGLVHRTACRHRDDTGARVRAAPEGRRPVRARGARACRECGAPGRRATWAPGWTRTVAKCSRALYRVADAPLGALARLVEVDPAAVGAPASTVERWSAGPPVDLFIGDGAVLYKEIDQEPGCRVPAAGGHDRAHGGRPCPGRRDRWILLACHAAVRPASGCRDRT